MEIRIAENVDQNNWDSYVMQHPEGLAYHLYAWKNAVEQAYGYTGAYLLAEEQGTVHGVLPLIRFKIPFYKPSYISLPYCDAAGPLGDNADICEQLLDSALTLAQGDRGTCYIRQSVHPENIAGEGIHKVRMILRLPDSSEALLNGFKAKLRSQIRKPTRDGLYVKTGTGELVDDFYQVFGENMRDLGSPVHSKKWLEAIMRFFQEAALMAVVYTAEHVPVAAGIILCHKKTVSIPWASSLREFNRLNPNMLLYWTFLSHAADHGYDFFDFGRSTPGEGTYRFKEQWGATPRALHWYDLSENKGSESARGASAKRQIAECVWQKLPVAVANAFGPLIRKRISL